uniref:Uncharacterized protein n=1 Tax=Physcomitrium patens TaxID=3218 RepID=A0A2K1IJ65_PHYPA|nr:uncharacterized protein LOC112275721 isoform X1 [Physcomitrium patens]XP_024362098.1 uncharacterized protein LOC112275721 isoform X1 [Physcomitrium patens]PNR29313.1 hypothetical protein PHYPA_028005 [Physcomitrium patens]|eukprot:XP_024362097.1 uncharacterized protein LOC112275721 isoform X1 [Physcomitrella patens]
MVCLGGGGASFSLGLALALQADCCYSRTLRCSPVIGVSLFGVLLGCGDLTLISRLRVLPDVYRMASVIFLHEGDPAGLEGERPQQMPRMLASRLKIIMVEATIFSNGQDSSPLSKRILTY